jgi:hypothetical protein
MAYFICVPYFQLRPGGTVCRQAENECDLTELCTGMSGECPQVTNIHLLSWQRGLLPSAIASACGTYGS